ncbi:MAG TPA: bifunctional 2-polyprenyl-6-hydroxyphenol methylase/3-demethylubiquinol 3-O-methyltransferase UbiG [Bauldia sp.]|jgi:2-polyprenyl-6-hydroxyphenyl methylase/3-demethylubiquinone-9 3-methyltransferase
MSFPSSAPATDTVDPGEIARFAAMAAKWWDDDGPMRPLHKLNPMRLVWIKEAIARRFARAPKAADALTGLRILDVGCGAGLICEPLARMRATVVGIDPSAAVIEAAKLHARQSGLTVDYRAATAETLAAADERFDVVLALEVVEHVTDVGRFVATCGEMIRPGGLLIASTINRTPKAFVLAIVGAEYVLRWLPRGTHTYDKLVTPDELKAAFRGAGLTPGTESGVMYVPFVDEFRLTPNLDVNYMMTAERA